MNEDWGLRTESVVSQSFAYGDKSKTKCVLELGLPEKGDWRLVLKVSSLEENQLAAHPMHYTMKVIEGKTG